VGLLVLNLGTLGGYTLPRRLAERTLAERAVALREEVARERALAEGLRRQTLVVGANARDMQRFLTQVVAGRGDLSAVLEELEGTARDLGLRPERRTYDRDELRKLPLVRFEVKLPLAGSYQQLMGFLDAMERSPRFATVDRVRFQDREGGSPGLDLTVSAYFAKASEHAR
jgi:Tfp pilus assembly protein PilO